MNCEACDQEHDGSYASGRFCCKKCAKGFATRATRQEINGKVSRSLKGRKTGRQGIKAGPMSEEHKKAISDGHKRAWADPILCEIRRAQVKKAAAARVFTVEQRQALRERAIKNKLSWPARKRASYAEQFTSQFLLENKFEFVTEMSVDRYYIDFAFSKEMVALEIDGKQHLWPERHQHDLIRDEKLRSLGWTVYRIPWESVKTVQGKSRMTTKLNTFIEWFQRCNSSVVERDSRKVDVDVDGANPPCSSRSEQSVQTV